MVRFKMNFKSYRCKTARVHYLLIVEGIRSCFVDQWLAPYSAAAPAAEKENPLSKMVDH